MKGMFLKLGEPFLRPDDSYDIPTFPSVRSCVTDAQGWLVVTLG